MPATVRDFCRRVLENGDLDSKLAPPRGLAGAELDDSEPGPALFVRWPARNPELAMRGGAGRLPAPGSLVERGARATCLARDIQVREHRLAPD